MIIGEVHCLRYPETAQRDDGSLCLNTIGLVAAAGLDTYAESGAEARFASADITSPPRQL